MGQLAVGVSGITLGDAVVSVALVAVVVVGPVRELATRVLVVSVADAALARLPRGCPLVVPVERCTTVAGAGVLVAAGGGTAVAVESLRARVVRVRARRAREGDGVQRDVQCQRHRRYAAARRHRLGDPVEENLLGLVLVAEDGRGCP